MRATGGSAPRAVRAKAASRKSSESGGKSSADVYSRIGVRPVINGVGTVTVLGGSIMPPEVVQAMSDASRHFVPMPELQRKVGARISELLKVPAAMVTCGAASSIAVATAACMAGASPKPLAQLPGVERIRHEVIQQKSHRSGYEHQMRIQGAKIVWVETAAEVERVISPKTAMMFFLNKQDGAGRIHWQEWVALAKKHGVPSFNDAAADVPPPENLWKYVHGGFDLVTFSGGKGLLGPQASGLLLGRRDLSEAARECISPAEGVGRGMKVGKEETIGLLAALELYLKKDHDAEFRELDKRVSEMTTALAKIDGVKLTREVPAIANAVPHLRVEWDEAKRHLTSQRALDRLRDGDPSIYVQRHGAGNLFISVWTMRGPENKIVAQRLGEILRNAG